MASKRRLRRRQCEGKVKHATAENAAIAIRKVHRAKGHQGQMHAYRCPFCGQFHVGHVQGRNGIGSAYGGPAWGGLKSRR